MIRIIIGILLVVIGLVLRFICIKTLKKNFTLALGIPEEIVQSGVYKYIRHPSYLGSLIMILGWSLISPVLGIMQIAFSFFLARIFEEEKKLCIKKDYFEYRKNTGMLIPKIRRHNG